MVETRAFEADVGRVLELVAKSLYSDSDIFLRELISNASDACDRLRHQAVGVQNSIRTWNGDAKPPTGRRGTPDRCENQGMMSDRRVGRASLSPTHSWIPSADDLATSGSVG